MRILGRNTLGDFQKSNKWLATWLTELAHARWWGPADVLKQFPKAHAHSNDLFLFQTEPKKYCIEVQFAFPQGIALITALTELTENNNE